MKKFAEQFEDLEIYVLLNDFRDHVSRDQMHCAALSVMNNIAEAFEKRTSKDFGHFLDIAKSSAGEVRSMTYAA